MAARSPRRSFAAPFVVTFAAAPACYVQSTPAQPTTPPAQPAQPPGPTQPGDAPPPPVVMNPPRPTPPAPPPTPSESRWTVFKGKDGCMAAIKVECQPNATCNPPPPFPYDCPPNTQVDPPITVVSRDGGSTCFVDWGPMKCPQGAICNPPPPRPVACPKR